MKKLALLLILVLLIEPTLVLGDITNGSDTYSMMVSRINNIEGITAEYQNLILNLNSQGALVSKTIKLLSNIKDLIWQSKTLLTENMYDEAGAKLEEALKLLPRITLDARSSFKVNKGRLALEESLSLIINARKQGYDVKKIEEFYDNANLLYSQAKESYMNEDYDNIDSKIDSVLDIANKISSEVEIMKNPSNNQNTVNLSPTGFMISNYSWVSLPVVITIAAALIILKVSKRRKELKGIHKLVRIKSRME
jgi:hypothetical protein